MTIPCYLCLTMSGVHLTKPSQAYVQITLSDYPHSLKRYASFNSNHSFSDNDFQFVYTHYAICTVESQCILWHLMPITNYGYPFPSLTKRTCLRTFGNRDRIWQEPSGGQGAEAPWSPSYFWWQINLAITGLCVMSKRDNHFTNYCWYNYLSSAYTIIKMDSRQKKNDR